MRGYPSNGVTVPKNVYEETDVYEGGEPLEGSGFENESPESEGQ
jgi:hypothetical protein